MPESLVSRMKFDTAQGQILDQDRRYLLMRTDVLMGIFNRLPENIRHQALRAFEASVAENGGKSAQAYYESLNRDAAQLIQTMVDFSAELGWGCWSFTEISDREIQLTVRNSPFAAGYGTLANGPVCYPIAGMLQTVGRLILDSAVTVTETQCCASGPHIDACQFTICSDTQ